MADGLPNIQGRAITRAGTISNAGGAEFAQARMFEGVAQDARTLGNVFRGYSVRQARKEALKDFNRQVELEQFADDIGGEYDAQFEKKASVLGLETWGDAAYNNMIETLYLQRTQTQIKNKANELRTQNFGDVSAFDKGMNAYREGLVQNLDPNFADEIVFALNQTQEEYRGLVGNDRQQNDIAEARQSMEATIQLLTDDIDARLREGGVEAASTPEVQELMGQLERQMMIRAENPLYGYSEEQRILDGDVLASKLEAAALLPEIKSVFNEKGYAAALETADGFAESLDRDTTSRERIRNQLRQEVNLLQQNASAARAEEAAQQKALKDQRKQLAEQYEKNAIDVINNPGASIQQKVDAVRAGRAYMSSTRYGTLMSQAMDEKAGNGVGDATFTALQNQARRGELEASQVESLTELTNTQRTALLNDIEEVSDDVMRLAYDQIDAAFVSNEFDPLEKRQVLATQKSSVERELSMWRRSLDHTPTPMEVRNQVNTLLTENGKTAALATQSRYLKVGPLGKVSAPQLADARERLAADYEEAVRRAYAQKSDMRDIGGEGDRAQLTPELYDLAEQRLLLDQIEESMSHGN